jgi:hypothetical protein
MSTTSAYGWNIPDNTDLVKDGALAIRTLGNAIDTSMNTALGTKKAGMVLLNTTSFSAVSSVSLPAGTFTSSYENYLVIIKAINSASNGHNFRFRASGTDVTSNNYYTQRVGIANATTSFSRSAPSTAADISAYGAVETFWELNVYRPQLTATTYWSSKASAHDGTTVYFQDAAGFLNVTTACDSLSWIVGSGTMTGEISAYGYNK